MNRMIKELGKKVVAFIPSKLWLTWRFKQRLGYRMDWKNPKTFNQKLQWLKVYDRNPEYTKMVDKYEAKKYVAERIGEEYIIPTLGVWDRFDDIDFDSLPDQFVLKCTHDSGGLVICRDKSTLDKAAAKKKIEYSLAQNYYATSKEWPYKNVKPRIIAEKYMEEQKSGEEPLGEHNLNVYKIFNFNGESKIIQVIQDDKQPTESIDYFDTNWELLNMKQNYPNSQVPLKKPPQLKEMLALAKTLSVGHSFIRTDFYIVDGQIYFSEYTFFSDSGMAKFTPCDWDEKLGDWIQLPSKRK